MNSRFSNICLELAEVFAKGTHFPPTFIFYILTIELSTSIKTSPNKKGDKKQTKYLITQYADDTVLTLADVLNSLTLISLTADFELQNPLRTGLVLKQTLIQHKQLTNGNNRGAKHSNQQLYWNHEGRFKLQHVHVGIVHYMQKS